MNPRTYLTAPAKLLVLFVLLAGIPFAALGWLGWRLIEQDRALENQRGRDRLENAASLLARELDRNLAASVDLLAAAGHGNSVTLPPGAVLIVFDSSGVIRSQGTRLPYYPRVSSKPDVPANVFAAAEALEFREGDPAKAAAAYRSLSHTRDQTVRAAALVRLARALRKQQQVQEALTVYQELAAMGETRVAGSPAELLARRERIAFFRLAGQEDAARREAESLASALSEGRYLIDRATFEFYSSSPADDPLAETVMGLWPLWQQQASGRAGAGAFSTVWRGGSAIVTSVDSVVAPIGAVLRNLEVSLALKDPSGRVAWGTAAPAAVTRTFRETGLPWTIRIAAANPTASSAVLASRRRLMSAGLGLMLLVIAIAGCFVFRAVSRELSVARLQSDFVAAVSHEFRTPLTTMRHMTDMLEEGGTPAERLPLYYRVLGKETRRLHAMVESLLDFGRMEAGRRTYCMEDADAAGLALAVVNQFREQSSIGPDRLHWQARGGSLPIRADREALTVALRNLLENAVKYSPDDSIVSVSVESQNGLAGISVEDQGAGIPKEEQREVFRKFSRGSAAKKLNVKGTGIGLTMADQIVKAHGGRLDLASEPGRGSRFTILLPIQAEQS